MRSRHGGRVAEPNLRLAERLPHALHSPWLVLLHRLLEWVDVRSRDLCVEGVQGSQYAEWLRVTADAITMWHGVGNQRWLDPFSAASLNAPVRRLSEAK